MLKVAIVGNVTNKHIMRWMLLIVGIMLHTIVFGQSTLKIYVANDDTRSDMDIIDLNTSALDRYGQSVDSTNINFYTTTMSTQVMRMSRLELFGPEEKVMTVEEKAVDLEGNGGNSGALFGESEELVALQEVKEDSELRNPLVPNRPTIRSNKVTQRSSKSRKRNRHMKKAKKIKKYRGQCPRFF